jgi:hypothetical protein
MSQPSLIRDVKLILCYSYAELWNKERKAVCIILMQRLGTAPFRKKKQVWLCFTEPPLFGQAVARNPIDRLMSYVRCTAIHVSLLILRMDYLLCEVFVFFSLEDCTIYWGAFFFKVLLFLKRKWESINQNAQHYRSRSNQIQSLGQSLPSHHAVRIGTHAISS